VVVLTEGVDGKTVAYPDSVVGTDSHTTMINGLGVLGWGVGGIEAEAVMLGQPIYMLMPQVVGFKLTGKLPAGATATDLVLTVTQILRKKGVVEKFVEFFGPGLADMSVENRATIANMAPEYGATCGFFPIDEQTLKYLETTGRDAGQLIAAIEAYAKAGPLARRQPAHPVHRGPRARHGTVEPCLAGPKPARRTASSSRHEGLVERRPRQDLRQDPAVTSRSSSSSTAQTLTLRDGDVVLAAITSCTNTSNPNVLIAAGLVARKAHARGLNRKPWVKTEHRPGLPRRHGLPTTRRA
jgi:aconitate hydratase